MRPRPIIPIRTDFTSFRRAPRRARPERHARGAQRSPIAAAGSPARRRPHARGGPSRHAVPPNVALPAEPRPPRGRCPRPTGLRRRAFRRQPGRAVPAPPNAPGWGPPGVAEGAVAAGAAGWFPGRAVERAYAARAAPTCLGPQGAGCFTVRAWQGALSLLRSHRPGVPRRVQQRRGDRGTGQDTPRCVQHQRRCDPDDLLGYLMRAKGADGFPNGCPATRLPPAWYPRPPCSGSSRRAPLGDPCGAPRVPYTTPGRFPAPGPRFRKVAEILQRRLFEAVAPEPARREATEAFFAALAGLPLRPAQTTPAAYDRMLASSPSTPT